MTQGIQHRSVAVHLVHLESLFCEASHVTTVSVSLESISFRRIVQLVEILKASCLFSKHVSIMSQIWSQPWVQPTALLSVLRFIHSLEAGDRHTGLHVMSSAGALWGQFLMLEFRGGCLALHVGSGKRGRGRGPPRILLLPSPESE